MNMNTILFANEQDEKRFYDFLAYRQEKKNNQDIKAYTEETSTLVGSCGEILEKYNARCNFVAEIINLNEQISSSDISVQDISRYSKLRDSKEELNVRLEGLMEELKAFISELQSKTETLAVGEDLERDSSWAFNRQKLLHELNQKNQTLNKSFPNLSNIDSLDIKSFYPFKQVLDMQVVPTFEDVEEKTVEAEVIDEVQEEMEMRPKVVRIMEAPATLLESISKASPAKDLVFEEETQSDNSFFDGDDALAREIADSNEIKPDAIAEAPNEEVSKIDEIINAGAPLTLDDAQLDETVLEPKVEEEVSLVAEPKDQLELKPSLDSIPYPMENGITLVEMAEAAFYDQKYWKYLYEYNKEVIDARLKEVGISFNDSIKDDEHLFEGLTINVPYNIPEKQDEVSMKMVA